MHYNKYKNIFNYYRGPSLSKKDSEDYYDKQIEDNTTKAFINTLEYLSQTSKLKFLESVGIVTDKVKSFGLQPSFSSSKPDAVIRTAKKDYYIESKVSSKLDLHQLEQHLANIGEGDVLYAITNSVRDDKIIKDSGLPVRHFTWNNIRQFIENIKTNNPTDRFLIEQFSNYLEDNNMTDFNGFKQKDFDAFLFIEEDRDFSARRNVKVRFTSFMEQLHTELVKTKAFKNMHLRLMGVFSKESRHIWGNFVEAGKKNVEVIHFIVRITSSMIQIGIQIEGKRPTDRFIKNLKSNPQKLTKICASLNEYEIDFYERFHIRVRTYGENPLARINLGKKFTKIETDYLINKINECDNKVIFTISKLFDRDDKRLADLGVIKLFCSEIKALKDLYEFGRG